MQLPGKNDSYFFDKCYWIIYKKIKHKIKEFNKTNPLFYAYINIYFNKQKKNKLYLFF